MRIISNFHDYYDTCKAYDQENISIYQRKSEEKFFGYSWIDKKSNFHLIETIPRYFDRRKGIKNINVNFFLIFFCGKRYACVKIHYCEFDSFKYTNEIDKFCYSFEEFEVFIAEKSFEDIFEQYKFDGKMNKLKEFFSNNGKSYDLEFFRKYNSPIITFKEFRKSQEYVLTINDSLKEYEFFKIFDPFTAYQEINMFVSGILSNPEKEMPKIPDKLKVQSHGFDEWSFRKKSKKS